jgi:hypothetical protein
VAADLRGRQSAAAGIVARVIVVVAATAARYEHRDAKTHPAS